jgi:multidrug efflux system membrane fusion protein
MAAPVARMGRRFVFPSEPETATQWEPAPQPRSVMVSQCAAERVVLVFDAEDQARPDRDTRESSGNVADLSARKGEIVEGGTIIALLFPALS